MVLESKFLLMKKTIILLANVFFSVALLAQAAITVTSEKKDTRFYLMVGSQQMNDFFETYVQIQNVPAGYHEVKVVFEGDSVADVFKNVMVKNGQEKIFLVSEKKDFKKSVNSSGRKVGKAAKIGKHDSTFNYLQDVYQMKLQSKTDYKATGEGLNISTEKTLSTSVMPATKKKH